MVECHGSQCGFCTPGLRDVALGHLRAPRRARHPADAAAARRRALGQPLPLHRLPADPRRRRAHVRRCRAAPLDTAPARAALAALQRDETFRYAAGGAELRWRRARSTPSPPSGWRIPRRACSPARPTSACGSTSSSATLPTLIYIGDVAELKRIETPRRRALDRRRRLARGRLARARRALADAAPTSGCASPRVPIRNAGTMGGNVANGSPIGDSRAGADGARREPGAAPRRARPPPGAGRLLHRLHEEPARAGRVRPGDRGAARRDRPRCAPTRSPSASTATSRPSAPASRSRSTASVVRGVRFAFGGMAATRQARGARRGRARRPALDRGDAARARSAALAADFQPLSDMRASAAYRLQVAQNLLRRLWLETRAERRSPRAETQRLGARRRRRPA